METCEGCSILFGHGDLPGVAGSPKPSKPRGYLSGGSVLWLSSVGCWLHSMKQRNSTTVRTAGEEPLTMSGNGPPIASGLLAEQLQGPVVQQPQRHDDQQHCRRAKRPEVADAEREAFAHRRSGARPRSTSRWPGSASQHQERQATGRNSAPPSMISRVLSPASTANDGHCGEARQPAGCP